MHDVQTLTAGQMLQKRGEECYYKNARVFSKNSPLSQKMEKSSIAKHCCVEFAVVNFVGRIKTAIKKSFQTYSIYSPPYAREFMEK